jgi:hypothetical protein
MTLHLMHYFQESTEQFPGLHYDQKFSDDVLKRWASLTQTVYRLDAGWTVWGSKLGGGEIFRIRPHRPWAHAASYTMSTGLSRR